MSFFHLVFCKLKKFGENLKILGHVEFNSEKIRSNFEKNKPFKANNIEVEYTILHCILYCLGGSPSQEAPLSYKKFLGSFNENLTNPIETY